MWRLNIFGKNTVHSSKNVHFCGSTYQQNQNWSFPDAIIYFITMYPSTPELYQKLTKTCKYFYSKNPIILLESISCNNIKFELVAKFKGEKMNFVKRLSNRKIWLYDSLYFDFRSKYASFPILSKFYKCDVKDLCLRHQVFTFKEFLFVSSKAEKIWLDCISVITENDSGSVLAVEEIVKILTNVKEWKIEMKPVLTTDTKKTMSKLVKIKHFLYLHAFHLNGISEVFDIETFYIYMKANKHTDLSLSFSAQPLSIAYKNRLDKIIDEIIQTSESLDYCIPFIYFPELEEEKFNHLRSLYFSRQPWHLRILENPALKLFSCIVCVPLLIIAVISFLAFFIYRHLLSPLYQGIMRRF